MAALRVADAFLELPLGRSTEPIAQISSTLGWESHPDRTLAVARSIYLRLPEGAKLRERGKEFVVLSQEAARAAFSIPAA